MNKFYGVIKCSGPDAKTFLQGQFSCDMEKISPEHGGMGAYCNLKGRVIALFNIMQVDHDYYLIMPKDIIPTLLEKLQKFAAFSKAELVDVSDEWFVYCYIDSPPVVGVALHATRMPIGHGLIVISTDQSQEFQNEATLLDWQKYLIANKIPTIALEQSEKFLPHYINLIDLKAVSFDKGCFVGQEVIARMHYRGKLKKQLESHVIEGEIPNDIGEVVNHVRDAEKAYVLSII